MEVKFFGGFVYVKTTTGMLIRTPVEAGEKFSLEGEIASPSEEEIVGEPVERLARGASTEYTGEQGLPRDYGVPQARIGIYGWVTRKPGAE